MKKKLKILVTGVGGAIGIGIVKSLKKEFGKDVKILGTDSSPLAPGFYLTNFLDDFCLVPKANEKRYIPQIIKIANENKIDLIFPGTDHEILPLSFNKNKFSKRKVKVVVSPPETIRICRDKWLTYLNLHKDLPIVKSALPNPSLKKTLQFIGLPAIIKPRLGWGTRDIYKVFTLNEAKILLKKVKNPVIQRYLEGDEYTIDGLADKNGKILSIVPRKRISTLAGLSLQGMTVKDDELIRIGKKITTCLKFIGPFNFQVRKESNRPFIFEINPRFAGTGILSVEAGVNLPALAVKSILGMPLPKNLNFKKDLIITRYIEDLFITKEKIITNEN